METITVGSTAEVGFVLGANGTNRPCTALCLTHIGNNIRKIQEATGTRILAPARYTVEKQFVIRGSADGIRRAKIMIQEDVQELRNRQPKQGELTIAMEVPMGAVGAIIGKSCSTLKRIQNETYTSIEYPRRDAPPIFKVGSS